MPESNPEREGHSRLRQSAPLVVSAIALALAAGGIGVGAGALITGADIKNGSITGADIKSGSIASDDIKSGAIQVSDLSKGALKGLDGKDGKDGKDGAQGPAGPAGPAGAGGSGGGASGGLKLLDGNGDEVTGIQPGIDPRFVISGTLKMSPTEVKILVGNSAGSQDGFVRYANDALWVMKRNGTYAPLGELVGYVFFKSPDCTGPMYQPAYTTGPFVQTTLPGANDNGVSPARVYYQQTGTETVTEGSSWSRYWSFGTHGVDCDAAAAGQPLSYGGAPSAGTVLQTYETTRSDRFPAPPAASTPPFSWSVG